MFSIIAPLAYQLWQQRTQMPSHFWVEAILFGLSLLVFLSLYALSQGRSQPATTGALVPAHLPLQPQAREHPQPNLVCLDDIGLASLELTDNDIFHERDDAILPGIVVRFANEPERGREVGAIENVMARFVFIGPNGERLGTVHTPYWIDEEFQSTDFFVGTVRGLVIGWLSMPGDDDGNAKLRTVSNNHEGLDRYHPPTWIDVAFPERQQVRVQIRLYAHNFLRECEVWFSLDSSENGEGFKFGILNQPA